jgi:hypothetical protein
MRNYAKVIKASDVKRDTKREQEMQKMAHGYAVLSNGEINADYLEFETKAEAEEYATYLNNYGKLVFELLKEGDE